MKQYLKLFALFARIGACTFGGGYAMLPILQREIVETRGWATDEELTDYYAIGQCTPGIIAINTATFIGYRVLGIAGGIVATLGVVFPSLVIITIIAAFLKSFAEVALIQHAFAGIRACVSVQILNSVLKLRKSTVLDAPTTVIFVLVLALMLFANFGNPTGVVSWLLSPAVLVILAGLVGLGLKGGRRA